VKSDNSIDVDIDDEEGVQAVKEPSLVEILAYKDTWRQGLDSFLTMLRRRLELLKELLAPTGSVYVHLDWHAVHYVKVMMDDVFGYENFVNSIEWQRTSSHNDPGKYGVINDSILYYGSSSHRYWGDPRRAPPPTYLQAHDIEVDKDGKLYRSRDLTAPGVRQGDTGKPWRGIDPTPKGRHWFVPPSELDKLDKDGLIIWPKKGELPRLKKYLSEDEGVPVQSIWTDIGPVNSQAAERSGYPTQKPSALLERIISASCPPGGLVLDCFMGSGTTCEAAERLGRRWIGIDNGKYAIHLARKRLIQLHGQPRPPETSQAEYVECEHCHNIERKEKKQKSPGPFSVRPFTVENMGVYQRAEQWQDFRLFVETWAA
jgi:adenine specific DNA methylase Mod